jgi:transcriptional regulator with XRE-family HTH domain
MSKPQGNRRSGRIDGHVAARIRERRIVLGLTQRQLAKLIGVSNQQAQKYELGINRISAGRLFEIACILDVPISYFYEGIGSKRRRQVAPHQRAMLAQNFSKIQNQRHQEAVIEVARVLAGR